MTRFLSKDLLSGLMFIAFGMAALYFGQKLALGTPVRMGPGYVPHMLSFILLSLGSIIVLATLFRTADRAEKERYWIPVAGLTVAVFAFSMIPWGANFIAANILGPANQAAFKTMTIPFMVSALLVIDVIILMILVSFFGRPGAEADDPVEAPKWKPITMVTIGIVLLRPAVRARRAAAGAGGAGLHRLAGRRGVQAHRGHRQHGGAVDPLHRGLQGRAGHEHLHRARESGDMDLLSNLALGLSVAVSFQNLTYALLGCMLGTLIGVLPGIGPVATIAMLLPITFHLPPTASLIMLAGIYYGAAVRRLDDLDPGQPAGRIVVGRHLSRRLPDGAQRPRRRGAVDLGGRLVLRRHRRHAASSCCSPSR